MSFNFDSRPDVRTPAPREIAVEAASEYAREPSYEELWGRARNPAAPQDTRRTSRDRLPTAAAMIAIILGVMALIGLRERIVRILPPAAGVYSALHLPVNLAGLELRDLRSRILVDGARKVLTIEGEIVNLRRDANHVPPVALTVRGENGLDRYAWTTPAPKSRLEPGEKIAFRARLASPPQDGADVLVRFASLEEATVEAPKASSAPVKAPAKK